MPVVSGKVDNFCSIPHVSQPLSFVPKYLFLSMILGRFTNGEYVYHASRSFWCYSLCGAIVVSNFNSFAYFCLVHSTNNMILYFSNNKHELNRDMKRYHTLLAGASWMAEYGNPDTDDWEFLKKYSPYHSTLFFSPMSYIMSNS